jgi:hypothetical protein
VDPPTSGWPTHDPQADKSNVPLIVGVIVVVILAVAVLAAPRIASELSLRDLHRSPLSNLTYPGSVVLAKADYRGSGGSSATERWLGSDATVDTILTFYLERSVELALMNGGGTTHIPYTGEQFACAWQDGDVTARLAFADQDDILRHLAVKGRYDTIYRWKLFSQTPAPASRPCSILVEELFDRPARRALDLLYPGSTVVLREDRSTWSRLIVSSNASSREIFDWYAAQLNELGFDRSFGPPPRPPLMDERSRCDWQSAEHQVTLGFLDPEALSDAFLEAYAPDAPTRYRWWVWDRPGSAGSEPCRPPEAEPSPS